MKEREIFLALTSDRRYWQTEGSVLFLGEWCLEEVEDRTTLKFPYQILRSPWDRKRDIDQVAAYLDEFCERILASLSVHLNQIHGINYTQRLWRILAGNWILHAVHSVYDRYQLLVCAMGHSPAIWTCGPSVKGIAFKTTNSFKYSQLYPDTSLFLLVLLAQTMGIRCQTDDKSGDQPDNSRYKTKDPIESNLKRLIKKLYYQVQLSLVKYGGRRALFINADIKHDLIRSIGAAPFDIGQQHVVGKDQVNEQDRREIFSELKPLDAFQRTALEILPSLLPLSLLENFELWKNHPTICQAIPKSVSMAVTTGGFSGDEANAHFLVGLAQSGCQLLGMQHGGGYGSWRYEPQELHEARCSDLYVTWGGAQQRSEQSLHHPLPSLYLINANRTAKKLQHQDSSRVGVLFLPTDRPHLTHRIQSHPLTGQLSRYYAWQERFYNALSNRAKCEFVLKPYVTDYVETKWYKGRSITMAYGDSRELMRTFKVLVFDHNGTGFLESLSANIPTLIYWDPELWELRDSAALHFDRLEETGILHKTPESAAAQLNLILSDPFTWWRNPNLQSARSDFCWNFARTTSNWKSEWKKFIEGSYRQNSSIIAPSIGPAPKQLQRESTR